MSSSAIARSGAAPIGVAAHAASSPPRLTWASRTYLAGVAVMALCVVLVVTGVPARMAYDASAPGDQNSPTSGNPLAMTNSLDANIKYLEDITGSGKGEYGGLQESVLEHEQALPRIAKNAALLTAEVRKMDAALYDVQQQTIALSDGMSALSEASSSSAATFASINSEIASLSATMQSMLAATQTLSAAMRTLEQRVDTIANERTAKARTLTEGINDALPATVPAPRASYVPDGGAQ